MSYNVERFERGIQSQTYIDSRSVEFSNTNDVITQSTPSKPILPSSSLAIDFQNITNSISAIKKSFDFKN